MITSPLTKLAGAFGGLALSLSVGAGIAAAAPDTGPMVNTTCDYSQIVSALNEQDAGAAAEFNSSPMAQGWLRSFLAAPPEKRQRMAEQAQNMPGADQYFGTVSQVAGTCNNY